MNQKSVFRKYTTEETWNKIVDYDSVAQMWQACMKNYADKTAIIDGEAYTYLDIDKKVEKVRAYLKESGIKKGDYVGVFMPNGIDFVIAFLGITTLGAVAVLLPPHLDATSVFGCSLKYSLKGLMYYSAFSDKLDLIKQKNPTVIVMDQTVSSDNACPLANVDGKDACAVIFTGGTTGKNKGALLSNQALMRGVKNGCYGTKDVFGLRYLLILPLTHVFGLIRNLMTSLYTGSILYICKNNKDMFRDIAIFKPTIMVMVPALAEMALNLSKQFSKNMLGDDLTTIICGAATVNPYLVKEYEKLGITLLAGYGLTESANLVSGNPESLKKPESVGYFYDGIDYKIVNGELWLKGINIMNEYVNEPEENKLVFEDGWFKTGDLVRVDEEGMLYIVGRSKEVIVLPSGENVSPQEIECKVNELDIVQDSLVYMEDDVLKLEVYPRDVVLRKVDRADKVAYLKEKISEVNEQLPSFMRFVEIKVRETDFERSPSMKILRSKNGQK